MFVLLKSTSTTVHNCDEEEEKEHNNVETCVCLTIWRKSLVFSCKGFTVIGSDGGLVYRVDNYSARPDRIILMDGSGSPIFTIRRHKRLRLVDNYWLVYEGEVGNSSSSINKPILCVRKNISIIKTKPSVVAYVYGGLSEKRCLYTIQGSYANRSCKILDVSTRVVSEIKRKEAFIGGVSFGSEVFHLIVKPGIDSKTSMVIVILLDQMFS